MPPRYLFGPVRRDWAKPFLARHLSSPEGEGDCLAFDLSPGNDLTIGPADRWEDVCGRLPAGWLPDFIALWIYYGTIPPCVFEAGVPVVALAGDWNLLWHFQRRLLARCDLVLTDTAGAEVCRRQGLGPVRAGHLFGCEDAYLHEPPGSEAKRDIDVLFVGNFQPAVQRERLAWIGRLANLRGRRVVVTTATFGEQYRSLHRRARIVFNRSIRGEANSRVFEATASGALLFLERGNLEVPALFDEGKEYVAYGEDDLEPLLEYYLDHEDERRLIAEAGWRRVQQCSFADFWQGMVQEIDRELPALRGRARPVLSLEEGLLLRTWQMHQSARCGETDLVAALEEGVREQPRSAALHNALAVALSHGLAARKDSDWMPVIEALRRAVLVEPEHAVARLNLAEALVAAGQTGPGAEVARQALLLLDRVPCLSKAALDAPHLAPAFDLFGVAWERAAWSHAGDAAGEERAKRAILSWRLHSLLATLTGSLAHYYETVAAAPDIPATQAALGCALARAGQRAEALAPLRHAVESNPFDVAAATALYQVLGDAGAWPEQNRLAWRYGRLHAAAPALLPARDWFTPPVAACSATPCDLGPVVWEGAFQTLHSLALVNRELCARLLKRGVPVKLSSTSKAVSETGTAGPPAKLPPLLAEALERPPADVRAVTVRHRWPPLWDPPAADGYWVVIQPWEFGSVPRRWAEVLKNQVDEVWAYSSYVRDCYVRGGVPADRVHVVPLGVDIERWAGECAPFPLRTSKTFRFLFVGGTLHRKGIDVLLRAYGNAFRRADDVCLVVKDIGAQSFYQGQTAEKLIADFQARAEAPEIEYLDGELSAEEMAALYRSCQCLVQPYRGEGFGLPIAEAMAAGLPVIVTGHGAALDFCDDKRAFLVPARLGYFKENRIDNLETVGIPFLAEPDAAVLESLLRHVVEHPEEARAKALKGAAYVRENLTWDHAAAAVQGRLAALPERPVCRLPAKTVAGRLSTPPRAGAPRVSLAMIVRDEEANLEACLRSVADLVDEMIVVDTGSTDRTREVAERSGAKVFDFVWVDDFAAARNESIKHATGQWILWLDADERLDETNRQRLRQLLASLQCQAACWLMRQVSPIEGSSHAAAQVDQVRLFPNRPDVRWQGRIHEQILLSLRRVGAEVFRTDIVIDHRGYNDPSGQAAKVDRNRRLLRLALAENPEDAFTLYNLATTLLPEHKDEALDCLRRSLANSPPHDPLMRKVYALIARIHQQRGQHEEALVACRAGRTHFPDDGELLFHEAVVLHEQRKWAGAEACLLELLRLPPGQHLMSSDAGLYSYRTRSFLGQVYRDQDRLDEAEAQWKAAVAECPGLTPAWLGLAQIYVSQNRWDDVEKTASEVAKDSKLAAEACVLRGRAQLARQQFAAAQQFFRQAIALAPEALLPRVLLSHALLQEGKDWAAAEQALHDVLALDPQNAEAQNNLRLLLKDRAQRAAAAQGHKQRVSLCMIVKNEEHNLPACLASVADLVDEMIVVDTGSTDATKAVALRHGAQVFDFAWIDHFAAARNESLHHATGHWIFWLDADDRIDEDNRAKLRGLFAGLQEENAAYIMRCHCLPDAGGVATVVDHMRLFRNRPDVRWAFRIHEQILPAVKASGGQFRRSDVVIQHTGYQDRALRGRKLERDLRILLLEQSEQPDHPFTLFNLGQVYKEMGQTREALAALTRSLRGSAPTDSIVRKLYALIAQCHLTLGAPQAALEVSLAAKAVFVDDLEILFQEGVSRSALQDWAGAADCWQRCLSMPPGDHLASFNPGLRGYTTRDYLAKAFRAMNRLAEAEAQWRAALSERPYYEPAWRGLMELLLRQLRWSELEALAQELEGGQHGALHAACVRGRVLLARQEFEAARAAIEQTIERFPAMVEPRELLSYVYLQEGRDWQAAERALKDVLQLVPDHMEAGRNLKVLYRERGIGHSTSRE